MARLSLKSMPVTMASRISLIIADILVIALTWWKLYLSVPSVKALLVEGHHLCLTDIYLRDGKRFTFNFVDRQMNYYFFQGPSISCKLSGTSRGIFLMPASPVDLS